MRIFYYVYWHDKRFKKAIGGPVKVWELADNLKQRGHAVLLFVPKLGFPERQTSAEIIAIPLIDLPILRFLSFHLICIWLTIAAILHFGKPQIVYVRIMWSILPMLFARILSVPVILEVNDSPLRSYEKMKNRWIKLLVRAVNRASYRLSDRILAVTQRVADELHTCDHVPREKVQVWESGANTSLFKPMNREACCAQLGLSPELLYVGFVGTCFEHQGVDVLIDCAPQVIRTCAQAKFLIVGDGPMKAAWQKQVAAKQLQPWFIFTGHIDYSRVPVYCNAMDVCVAPFLQTARESSGVKVFEYLSCGKPVVLSNIQDSGKQFLPSNAVILAPAENIDHLTRAICTLLLDPEKRRAMGQNGRAYIRRHYDRLVLSGRIETLAEALIRARRPHEGPHG